MTDELPPGWAVARLESLIGPDGIMTDGDWVESKDQDPDGEVRLIQLADVGDGSFLNKSNRFLTQAKAEKLDCTFLQPRDVLISRLGDPLGKACLFPKLERSCVTVVDVHVVRPASSEISREWLVHLLNSAPVRRVVDAQSSGTTRKRITGQKLKDLEVRVAPAPEQQRIASKIDELFSLIDEGERALEQVQRLVERYRQSVLKTAVTGELTRDWREKNKDKLESGEALLTRILKTRREAWEKAELEKMKAKGITPANDKWKQKYQEPVAPETDGLPELPERWTWASMDQLLVRIEAGKSFRCDERPPNDDEYGLVKVSAVTWGIYDEHESKTITDTEKIVQSYLIRENDFLFSRANTIKLVGASVIVRSVTKRLLLSDKILRFVFAFDLKEWVDTFLKSQLGRAQIESLSTGNQESMRNIGQERISRIAVPLPPEGEIRATVDQVSSELQRAHMASVGCQQEVRRAQATRQSVLKAAFSGLLVPHDVHDESAADLLQRIATERNNTPVKPKRGGKSKTSETA